SSVRRKKQTNHEGRSITLCEGGGQVAGEVPLEIESECVFTSLICVDGFEAMRPMLEVVSSRSTSWEKILPSVACSFRRVSSLRRICSGSLYWYCATRISL